MKLSAILRDSPISTLDNALYWIEHVIKHGGARHLRPASLDISWYQYLLLDVLPILLAIVIFNIFITVALCKKCCCGKRVKKYSKQD
jgi:glucuronosyltransferase